MLASIFDLIAHFMMVLLFWFLPTGWFPKLMKRALLFSRGPRGVPICTAVAGPSPPL